MQLHEVSTTPIFESNCNFSKTFKLLGVSDPEAVFPDATYFINFHKYTDFPCILYDEEWLTLCLKNGDRYQITWDELRDFMGYSKTLCAKMLSANDVEYAKLVFTSITNGPAGPSQSNLLNEAWYNNTYTSPANIAKINSPIGEPVNSTPKPPTEKSLKQLLEEITSYTKPKYAWVLGKNGLTTSDEPPIPF